VIDESQSHADSAESRRAIAFEVWSRSWHTAHDVGARVSAAATARDRRELELAVLQGIALVLALRLQAAELSGDSEAVSELELAVRQVDAMRRRAERV
jgi:hypothetical protein